MPAKPQLIDILAQNESIAASELDRAVRTQTELGIPLAEVLVQEDLLQEDDIFFMLQRALATAAVPEEALLHLTLSPEIRRRVPRSFASAQALIPLDLDVNKGLLLVAMFDPSDRQTLDKVRDMARVAEVRPYLARRSSILNALKSVYSEADELRVEEPEWLPEGTRAGDARGAGMAAEPKVEIDPGLVEELEVMAGAKVTEPLRSIRVPRSVVYRATDAAPVSPPAERLADRPLEEDKTAVFESDREVGVGEDTAETVLPADELDVDPDQERLNTALTPPLVISGASVRTPDAAEVEQSDALLRELLVSVGVLISMLEERVDPEGGSCREYGRLTRAVARELGLGELSVARIALAAQLFALDLALRRELGISARLEVTAAFAAQPSAPGGLGPSLRSLGAKALGLDEKRERRPLGVAIILVVADYMELRAESDESIPDPETVAQLLRTGGADPSIVEALMRAMGGDTPRVRLGPPGSTVT
jgi:hypothetical protein